MTCSQPDPAPLFQNPPTLSYRLLDLAQNVVLLLKIAVEKFQPYCVSLVLFFVGRLKRYLAAAAAASPSSRLSDDLHVRLKLSNEKKTWSPDSKTTSFFQAATWGQCDKTFSQIHFYLLLISKQHSLFCITDGTARIFAYHLLLRRDSSPCQQSSTRLGPLKDALLTELQRCNFLKIHNHWLNLLGMLFTSITFLPWHKTYPYTDI